MAGLLLAAGSGRRFGGPKALADDGDGPWVLRALSTLTSLPVSVVVVGAQGDEVAALLPPTVEVVRNPDHQQGMGSSLRAGLSALMSWPDPVDAALVVLVDLPGLTEAVVHRLAASATGPECLSRAAYDGVPGHPVVLGREHWPGVIAAASGDRGARGYLSGRDVVLVECADIGDGTDVDTRG